MKTSYVLLSLTVISLCFPACSGKDRTPGIDWRPAEYSFTLGDCDSTSTNCIRIDLNYFEVESAMHPAAADSIEQHLMQFILAPIFGEIPADSPEALKDALVEDYRDLKSHFPDSAMRYELERSAAVELDTPSVFSFSVNEFFTGGAHPITTTFYVNIDVATGRRLTLDDVIAPGREQQLTALAEPYFRTARDLSPDEDLNAAGFWFENGTFSLTGNFLLAKTGITFYFNRYEIAPYYFGPTEISIPYGELNGFITVVK